MKRLINVLLLTIYLLSQSAQAANITLSFEDRLQAELYAADFFSKIDHSKADETWDMSARYVHEHYDRHSWIDVLSSVKKLTGKITLRTTLRFGGSDLNSENESGKFFMETFKIVTEKGIFEEDIHMSFEDNQWKVMGYFVRMTPSNKPKSQKKITETNI